MSISIDTILSLDASKSYYIANSTGEIAEATPWQKFKSFFGIGDGRHKAAKLLDEVKVALLQASGETETRKVVLAFTRSGAINCKLVSERTGTTVEVGEEKLAVGPGSSMKVNASLSLSNKEVNALEKDLDLNAFDPDAEIAGPYLLNMPPVGADASFTINEVALGN